jgi:predicted acylesterase/phospholipase RssA
MGWIGWIVGSRQGRLVAGVLLVGLLSLAAIQYIRSAERDKIETENLQKQIEIRRNIDDAVINSPNSVDDAIEFLRERQQ